MPDTSTSTETEIATTVTLDELTSYIRSKNAGPFWQTIDLFFVSEAAYRHVLATGVLNQERIGSIYGVASSDVKIFEMDHLFVVKVSFPRAITAGSFEDRDLHAGQQHVPIAAVRVAAP